MPVEPIPDKWRAFGWHVIECDGHDIAAIVAACEAAKAVKGRPSVIVAQTVKGKGVSFMENTHLWHAALVSEEQEERALAELCALEAAHDA
jgi:transketolase